MVAMGSTTFPSRQLTFTPMPTPPYIDDQFADVVGTFLGLLFTVVFLWPVTRIIKLIVEEKETRIKEGMKMMGLYDSTLWLSWLLTYTLIFIITSIFITAITAKNVFQYSDKAYIFFFFLLAQMSFFSFCLLVSAVFSQSRVGSTFGALVFLAIFFPYYAVFQDSVSTAQKTLACLSPPLCMGLGVTNIIQFEGAQVGVNRDNVRTKLNNFDYSTTMGMLLLDFIGLILLALYLDKVLDSTVRPRTALVLPRTAVLLVSFTEEAAHAQQSGSARHEPHCRQSHRTRPVQRDRGGSARAGSVHPTAEKGIRH